jgi:hypothetical protein
MKIRNFLSGALLGVVATALFSSQHYSAKIEENATQHEETMQGLAAACQRRINALEDVDELETCLDLVERNIELEITAVKLNQQLIQAEISCLLKIYAERRKCKPPIAAGVSE